jgi:predicted PurR-regulated permease PerM
MADRAGKLLTPLARFLTPRNLTVAIIAILLPFVILPAILGYLGYTKARNDIYQSTSDELGGMIQAIDAQVNQWQANGLERVQALSQDPAVVTAAA